MKDKTRVQIMCAVPKQLSEYIKQSAEACGMTANMFIVCVLMQEMQERNGLKVMETVRK